MYRFPSMTAVSENVLELKRYMELTDRVSAGTGLRNNASYLAGVYAIATADCIDPAEIAISLQQLLAKRLVAESLEKPIH